MSKEILFIVYFILASGIVYAQPFGPPLYIANPETMECRYYFAGDVKHFNPRPENFTVNIGYTTDFKNIDQACAVFKCASTNGTVLVDENKTILEKDLCRCPEGKIWNESKGCISGGDLLTGKAVFTREKTGLNYLAIIITILIIIGFVFFIKKVKK